MAANLALLGGFKWSALEAGLHTGFLSDPQILIPLALSFITFQQIGFLVDCHRGHVAAPRLFDYLFFVAFFPQLVMGPILRHEAIVGQLRDGALARRRVEDVAVGLAIFVFGLARKVLLADSLAQPVDRVFLAAAAGAQPAMPDAWVAAVGFQLQLFLDFSAYADMAIGLGRMVGINLPINFDAPFKAIDRFDLWRRWHITFVLFMRAHVFLPLVRHARWPVAAALAGTGILSGLWHGLGWSFVLWGLVQTALLLGAHLRAQHFRRARTPDGVRLVLAIATTFLVTCLVGVLFRAPSVDAALAIYRGLFDPATLGLPSAMAGWLLRHGILPADGWPAPVSALTGVSEFAVLAAAAAAVWGWPDTRHFFARHWTAPDPRPDPPRRPAGAGRVRFALTSLWAGAFGILLVLATLWLGQANRFVYVQF